MKRPSARVQDRFVDPVLGLVVVEALVRHGLVTTELCVPEPAPGEDDDPDDESESWRDRIDEDALRIEAELRNLLDIHAAKLSLIEEIDDVFIDIYEGSEELAEVDSLAGIEVCSGLERLTFNTNNKKLDLTPLAALPRLEALDLGRSRIRDLSPLLALKRLREVTGRIDARTAAALRERGVTVTVADD